LTILLLPIAGRLAMIAIAGMIVQEGVTGAKLF
jgi:hypothetical protein